MKSEGTNSTDDESSETTSSTTDSTPHSTPHYTSPVILTPEPTPTLQPAPEPTPTLQPAPEPTLQLAPEPTLKHAPTMCYCYNCTLSRKSTFQPTLQSVPDTTPIPTPDLAPIPTPDLAPDPTPGPTPAPTMCYCQNCTLSRKAMTESAPGPTLQSAPDPTPAPTMCYCQNCISLRNMPPGPTPQTTLNPTPQTTLNPTPQTTLNPTPQPKISHDFLEQFYKKDLERFITSSFELDTQESIDENMSLLVHIISNNLNLQNLQFLKAYVNTVSPKNVTIKCMESALLMEMYFKDIGKTYENEECVKFLQNSSVQSLLKGEKVDFFTVPQMYRKYISVIKKLLLLYND